jgi:hypothetical protein
MSTKKRREAGEFGGERRDAMVVSDQERGSEQDEMEGRKKSKKNKEGQK